ncbi:MAG: PDZ domain-containing protein [Bdellovibrionaceae bacterium]|nr:PDZ domain-containing protein [Bdellovibrio sp.]
MVRILVVLLAVATLTLLAGCSENKNTATISDKSANAVRVLTKEERSDDFDQLLKIFKNFYGPYQLKEKNLKISIEKLVQEFKEKSLVAQTDEEFMSYVMQFGATLHDGHVQFVIEHSASNILRYRIPILLTPIEGKAIVGDVDKELSSVYKIAVGDEVIAIDGKTPSEIMAIGAKYRHAGRDLTDTHFHMAMGTSRLSYMTDLIPKSPLAAIKFKTASSEQTVTVEIPWQTEKYVSNLDNLVKQASPFNLALDLSVPYVDDFNSQVNGHRGQMGQVNPVFLTPEVLKKYNFIKVYPSDAARLKFGLAEKETPPIYAALYKFSGKTILLVRQATYHPEDFKPALYMKAYMALISEYQDLADVLVLDQTHNPGGSYCAEFYNLFANEGDVQSVEDVRADRKWINDLYVNWPAEEGPTGNPWELKLIQSWGRIVEKAYDEGRFLSEPFPLFVGTNYATRKEANWKKPMLVLIDELAGSCGDMFPMLVKANKRAQLFGQNTMGLGGNVEQVGQLNNSRIQVKLTRGLFHPYRADGAYVPSDLIENNGVAPDIEYAHTVKDFRAGYVDYVKAFSEKAVEQIK